MQRFDEVSLKIFKEAIVSDFLADDLTDAKEEKKEKEELGLTVVFTQYKKNRAVAL